MAGASPTLASATTSCRPPPMSRGWRRSSCRRTAASDRTIRRLSASFRTIVRRRRSPTPSRTPSASACSTCRSPPKRFIVRSMERRGTMKSFKPAGFLIVVLFAQALSYAAFAQDTIRVGVPLFPTVSFPVFIAQQKGIFEKNGLRAELIRINSEPTTYQALISGDIDATSGAPTGLIQSNLQGIPVVSLGSWDNHVSYTMVTKEKIDDLAQLKGKKIGITRLGGTSSLILRVMLEDAGLNTSKDVTLLQLGGSQERLAALMRGGVDAAPVDFAFEPKMKQMGVFLVRGKLTPFMNGPIAVTAASLKANRPKWVRFVKSYLEATAYMMTNREGSIDVLKRSIGLDDKETLEHTYNEMRARATVDLVPPDAAVDNLIKMMTYVDKRATTVDKAKLADYSILKELQKK